MSKGKYQFNMGKVETYTSSRWKDILIEKEIGRSLLEKVLSIYRNDFEMFGFEYPNLDFLK